MLSKRNKQEVCWILSFQWMVLFAGVMMFWVLSHRKIAMDVVLGGLLSALPTALFAKMAFRHQGAQKIKQIMKGFYWGEVIKILTTVVMGILVAVLFHPIWWALFVGFILAHLGLCIAPLFFVKRELLRT